MKRNVLYLIVLCILIFSGCASNEYCAQKDYDKAISDLNDFESRLNTEIQHADNTVNEITKQLTQRSSLIQTEIKAEENSLNENIAEINDVITEIDNIEVPVCLNKVIRLYKEAYPILIEAYQSFIDGSADQFSVQYYLFDDEYKSLKAEYESKIQLAKNVLVEIQDCVPFCEP